MLNQEGGFIELQDVRMYFLAIHSMGYKTHGMGKGKYFRKDQTFSCVETSSKLPGLLPHRRHFPIHLNTCSTMIEKKRFKKINMFMSVRCLEMAQLQVIPNLNTWRKNKCHFLTQALPLNICDSGQVT